jgi:hypothetical protein
MKIVNAPSIYRHQQTSGFSRSAIAQAGTTTADRFCGAQPPAVSAAFVVESDADSKRWFARSFKQVECAPHPAGRARDAPTGGGLKFLQPT